MVWIRTESLCLLSWLPFVTWKSVDLGYQNVFAVFTYCLPTPDVPPFYIGPIAPSLIRIGVNGEQQSKFASH